MKTSERKFTEFFVRMQHMGNMTLGRGCDKSLVCGDRPGPWVATTRGSRKALLTGGGRCLPSAELAVLARDGEAGEGLREGAGPPQGADGGGGEASFSTTGSQVSSR